jgi:hypothetical protein
MGYICTQVPDKNYFSIGLLCFVQIIERAIKWIWELIKRFVGGSIGESPKSILGVICAAFENMFPSFDDHSVDKYVKATREGPAKL